MIHKYDRKFFDKLSKKLVNNTNPKKRKYWAAFVFPVYYFVQKKYFLSAIDWLWKENMSSQRKRRLVRKMMLSKIIYRFAPYEFYAFGLEKCSFRAMECFIPDIEHMPLCVKMNDLTKINTVDDKFKAYKAFGKYYGRDVSFISNNQAGRAELIKFAKKHGKFMAKTVDGSCGEGITMVETGNYSSPEAMCDAVFQAYKNGFVAEELIVQTEETARFNPSTVNTFRMPTYRFADRTEVRNPFMRMGRSGSIVDNAAAGGIFAMIDEESGIIYAAVDKLGNNYSAHPDTGVQIIGYRVAQWEEIKSFAIALAQVIPENRHIGWDVAVTDKGCVMVEGNSCPQFVHQIALKKGFRPELEAIMKEMGV